MKNQKRQYEILAVVLTALGKFLFMDFLNLKFLYISMVVVLWTAYVVYEARKNKSRLKEWGFRTDNIKKSVKAMLPFGLFALIACVGIGAYNGTLNVSWHILPILALYPIWGIIQQFLLISLVAGNMKDVFTSSLKNWQIVVITAVIFALVHFPYWWLILATFLLALLYGTLFLKERNIYVLGFFHGWLGAICFYTIVDRDPFVEIFLK